MGSKIFRKRGRPKKVEKVQPQHLYRIVLLGGQEVADRAMKRGFTAYYGKPGEVVVELNANSYLHARDYAYPLGPIATLKELN